MTKRIGVDPVPDDAEKEQWLQDKLKTATELAKQLADGFEDAAQYSKEQNEPEIFAYARLLNHVAGLDQPTLIRILSAFVWHNNKGQEKDA